MLPRLRSVRSLRGGTSSLSTGSVQLSTQRLQGLHEGEEAGWNGQCKLQGDALGREALFVTLLLQTLRSLAKRFLLSQVTCSRSASAS